MGTNFLTPLLGYKILYTICLSRTLRMNTDIQLVYRGVFASQEAGVTRTRIV
jgi:hypothetical protein